MCVLSCSDGTALLPESWWMNLKHKTVVQQSELDKGLHNAVVFQEEGYLCMCPAVPPHHLGMISLRQVDGLSLIVVVDRKREDKKP